MKEFKSDSKTGEEEYEPDSSENDSVEYEQIFPT